MNNQYEEEILIEDEEVEDEAPVSYDIATYPSDYTLWGLNEMYQEGDIVIPPFQREFVWTIRQSSLLIESFLLGLPVPPVFFYIDEENKSQVIDGQQRILSVCYFFEGYFGGESTQEKRQVFRLHGLDEESPYSKKKYPDLEGSDQRKLRGAVLRAINVRQVSPKDDITSIYHIFERLNTGGTALKPQEIRNCVFRGDFIRILRELNADKNWRLIMGKKPFDKHQKDVELVLRMLSLSKRAQEYEKPMKEFLNKTMNKERKGSSDRVKRFIKLFPVTTKTVVKHLGEKPFHVRGPLNTSVLDSVFCNILDNIRSIPENLKERFNNMLTDTDFIELTTKGTTDTYSLRNRFDLAFSYLIKK